MQLHADLVVDPKLEREFKGHEAQTNEPAVSANVLAAHVVHDVAPAADDDPTGQMVLVILFGHDHPAVHTSHDAIPF
jgi:hypothetical protein